MFKSDLQPSHTVGQLVESTERERVMVGRAREVMCGCKIQKPAPQQVSSWNQQSVARASELRHPRLVQSDIINITSITSHGIPQRCHHQHHLLSL